MEWLWCCCHRTLFLRWVLPSSSDINCARIATLMASNCWLRYVERELPESNNGCFGRRDFTFGGWGWGMNWCLWSMKGLKLLLMVQLVWQLVAVIARGEPLRCDLLCPGCPQWEQWFCLLNVAGLCVLLPLCITLWGTLGCGIINYSVIALS